MYKDDVEVDKVADMVADMKVDKVADMVANMVADMSCFNLVWGLAPNFFWPEDYVPDLRVF